MEEPEEGKESFEIRLGNISPDRSLVIHISTQVEHYINLILKFSLGFAGTDTISFGDTNRALSFNAKINLLLDFKGIDNEDQAHLIKLSEIRNQFAHNFSINSFTSLNSNKNGRLSIKHLEKFFSESVPNYTQNNENLRVLFIELSNKINLVISKVLAKLEKSAHELGHTEGAAYWQKTIKMLLKDPEFMQRFTKEELKGIDTLFSEANATLLSYLRENYISEELAIKGKKLL